MNFADYLKSMVYASACFRDRLKQGKRPFGSHVAYGLATDDNTDERRVGIKTGDTLADELRIKNGIIFTDKGISPGMRGGKKKGERRERNIEYMSLGEDWESEFVNEHSYFEDENWLKEAVAYLTHLDTLRKR